MKKVICKKRIVTYHCTCGCDFESNEYEVITKGKTTFYVEKCPECTQKIYKYDEYQDD